MREDVELTCADVVAFARNATERAYAVDGWSVPLLDTHVSVAALRERAGLVAAVTTLEPAWDVTGSEVDIGAGHSVEIWSGFVGLIDGRPNSHGRADGVGRLIFAVAHPYLELDDPQWTDLDTALN